MIQSIERFRMFYFKSIIDDTVLMIFSCNGISCLFVVLFGPPRFLSPVCVVSTVTAVVHLRRHNTDVDSIVWAHKKACRIVQSYCLTMDLPNSQYVFIWPLPCKHSSRVSEQNSKHLIVLLIRTCTLSDEAIVMTHTYIISVCNGTFPVHIVSFSGSGKS